MESKETFAFTPPQKIYVVISWDFCVRIKNRGKEDSGNAREGQSSSEAYTVQSHFAKKIIRAFSIVSDVLEKLLPKKRKHIFIYLLFYFVFFLNLFLIHFDFKINMRRGRGCGITQWHCYWPGLGAQLCFWV